MLWITTVLLEYGDAFSEIWITLLLCNLLVSRTCKSQGRIAAEGHSHAVVAVVRGSALLRLKFWGRSVSGL